MTSSWRIGDDPNVLATEQDRRAYRPALLAWLIEHGERSYRGPEWRIVRFESRDAIGRAVLIQAKSVHSELVQMRDRGTVELVDLGDFDFAVRITDYGQACYQRGCARPKALGRSH